MRYIITFFILFSFSNYLFSQINLDSLWNVWEDENKEDTVRVKALLDYNKGKYIKNNQDSALIISHLANEFSIKIENNNFLARSFIQEGQYYDINKKYEEAISCYQKAVSNYELIKNQKKLIDSYFKIGYAYLHNNVLDKAEENTLKGKAISYEIEFDEGKMVALYMLARIYEKQDKSKAGDFYLKSLGLARENKDSITMGRIAMRRGLLYVDIGEIDKAIEVYKECVLINEKLGNSIAAGKASINLGVIYANQGDFEKAITNYNKCSEAYRELDENHYMIAGMTLNIGGIYQRMEDYEKAMESYKNCLDVALSSDTSKLKVKELILIAYFNIGEVYHKLDNYVEAIKFYNKVIVKGKETTNLKLLARLYENLGRAYMDIYDENNYKDVSRNLELKPNFFVKIEDIDLLRNTKEALNKGLEIAEKTENKENQARIYLALGELYSKKGKEKDLAKSLAYTVKSYNLAKGGSLELIKLTSAFLYKSYKKRGEHKKALLFYETFIESRDSLQNKENQKAIIQHEYRSQYEKQAAADSIAHLAAQKVKEIQIAKQNAEIESKKLQQYALFGGLGLVVLFALFMMKKNKQIQQQKKEIEVQKDFAEEQQQFAESQKEELSLQHNQIRDSIDYAQTLQKAVLPSFEDVTNNFSNNFVYFQPKDVVSGDFFWTFSKKGIKYLAVVDCTGHGVPGAFMTIVANNLLNEIVLEDYTTPKEIIEELHKRIKVRVGGHKDAKVRDSMDLGLLSYNSKSKQVNFVGTHTSLYLVRNSKLQKIKGSKADIGYSEEIKLEEHLVEVLENDMLYLHSDGYPDQKGGAKGKKFYYQPIRNKFEEICLLNLEEQKSIMQKTFNDWKADKEQLDDVCMIGVRV